MNRVVGIGVFGLWLAGSCFGVVKTAEPSSEPGTDWPKGLRVVASPLKRGGDAPSPIAVNVTGAEELQLVATVGFDDYDYDQAVWAEPQFVMADGSRRDATVLPRLFESAGWRTVASNRLPWGPPVNAVLDAAGFTRFIGAHAPSRIVLAVPKNAVRFEAKVLLTSPKGKGSVVFRAEAGSFLREMRRRTLRETVIPACDSLLKLVDHLASKPLTDRAALAAAHDGIVRLRDALNASVPPSADALDALEKRLTALRRRVMVELNPAVDFTDLLFIRRKNGRSFRPINWQSNCRLPKDGHDNELCRFALKGASAGQAEVIYRPPAGRPIADVDLHWNADRLLFSGIGTSNAWQVMELDLATRRVRQVTPADESDVENYDACYVPDGRIVFSSTAMTYAVPCVWGNSKVANLFRCNSDGSGMELLCNDQEHAWCPTVLADGRILYLRWEYTDLPHSNSRILFTCNPDGTNQRAYYGSNSFWPGSMFYARPVPGRPSQFVAVLTGHHGLRREGQLGLFDVNLGTEEAEGAIQLMPGHGKKVEPIVRDQLYNGTWPMNLHPFPLDDTTFLVARRNRGEAKFSLFLVDRFDNELCILREAGHDLVEPVPLKRTPVPPVVHDRTRPGETTARVYVADVYDGPGLKGIPRGTVKELRLYTYTFGFEKEGGLYGTIGFDGPWDMRRTLGTVKVAPDGSAFFRVPANTPIAVQPLDAEGKSLQVMRSWFTARSGEFLSCAGCHEKQRSAAASVAKKTEALGAPPQEIRPWRGPERNYEFVREVQPVLDAYCVRCHNEPDPPHAEMFGDRRWKPDLRSIPLKGWNTRMHGAVWKPFGGKFSVSYFNLVRFVRHPGIESDIHLFEPMEWHADTTELVMLLQKGHHGVKLSDEAWDRLITWIDFNAPYHGRWQTIVGDVACRREALREKRRERYTGLKCNHETIDVPAPVLAPPPVGKRHTHVDGPVVTAAGWPFDPKTKPSANAGALALGPGVEMPLVAIPGGRFVMGTNRAHTPKDERPAAVVEVKGFAMGVREVTNREFRQFDPAHDSRCESRHGYQFGVTGYDVNGDDLPVVRVSWTKAQAFCRWLSQKTGRTVRLPTEAEWEWAARAGSDRPFWWGAVTNDFARYANLADISLSDYSGNPYVQDRVKARYGNVNNLFDNWVPQAHAVNDGAFLEEKSGKWQANPWGLYDMHGNVWEWTQSKYVPYPYVATDGRNAPDGDGRRVVRGGSWYSRPKLATASFRRAYRPYAPVYDVGFRVVVETDAK